jgi:hypothetical protein
VYSVFEWSNNYIAAGRIVPANPVDETVSVDKISGNKKGQLNQLTFLLMTGG